jgi:hypothetical protein
MMFSNPKCTFFAVVAIISNLKGGNAFVPDGIRARIGGGKISITASPPSESLSFTPLFREFPKEHQQLSPRLSESSFRLDYIQGIRPSYNNYLVNTPLEDDHENTNEGMYTDASLRAH